MEYFYSAMDSFAWGVLGGMQKLVQTLGIPLCDCNGSSPEFEAEREKWLQTSSRDSILADFTRHILQGRPGVSRGVFSSVEVANLESVFAAHADWNYCWDQKSLESYLLTHTSNDEKVQALLTSCMPSLWKLVTYFSQWPFISTAPSVDTTSQSIARLPYQALARGIAFICGRHSKMFRHYNHEKDADVPPRKDRLALEDIFRALAIDACQGASIPTLSSPSRSFYDDVLDTLNTVQPVMNECTHVMNRGKLIPLATRLLSSPGSPAPASPLSSLTVLAQGPGGLLELLDLFVMLLRHSANFDKTPTPLALAEDLETSRAELEDPDGISFAVFAKWLDKYDYLNFYDAVALLFNTFPYPKSLTDGIGQDEDDLLLYSLRRPGLKLVHH